MLGLLKKTNNYEPNFDYDNDITHYEGGAISAEYVTETLISSDINRRPHPFHCLLPHVYGKIFYSLHGEIIEQYEGELEIGQYHGQGVLIDRYVEIYGGWFKENNNAG